VEEPGAVPKGEIRRERGFSPSYAQRLCVKIKYDGMDTAIYWASNLTLHPSLTVI
jgi:hypothetical protein